MDSESMNYSDELGLNENALTVLRKRYLARDCEGNSVETPREMLERVARNVAIMDVLYWPEIYDSEGDSSIPVEEEVTSGTHEVAHLTPYDLDTLKRAYSHLAREGQMKVGFDEVCEMVGERVRDIRESQDSFFRMISEREFVPNSPTLMNAGRELQQLSACFVLPIEDSMESIFESIKNAALIHKSGGGTGFSFTRLRPTNDVVRTTGGIASGPVSFLKVFNAATEAVKQGGTRRGANMGILRVDHPDIREFITCKRDNEAITNFNLSVGITDAFMDALEREDTYALVNPRDGSVVTEIPAQEVFDLLVDMAWKNGEPGVIFLDRMNANNPTPAVGMIESTNPCGEQPLLPYESCNLGSVNLSAFVESSPWYKLPEQSPEPGNLIRWDDLAKTVHGAVHFLDNVIDANRYPVEQIGTMTRASRKIGLGVMGWAEMLLKLGIPYDSEEAVALAVKLMGFIDEESKKASRVLAEERGVFPNYEKSVYAEKNLPLRNATTTTIAPTGTISIIGGTSSGVEPLFSLAFTRHVMDGEKLVEANGVFEDVARAGGFYSEKLMASLASGASLQTREDVPEHVKRVFVTALDISPRWHINMQAAFQAHTDNAVSKTINFPKETAREDISQAFTQAYQLGCKGLTVYRVGSREDQVLVVGKEEEQEQEKVAPAEAGLQWGNLRPISRTSRLRGMTVRKATPMGNLFLTLNMHRTHPFELFAQIGKAGSDVSAFTEGIARLISLAFRCGVDPQVVADQLIGIGGSRSVGFGPNRVRSVPDAIGQFIEEFVTSDDYLVDDDDSDDNLTQLDLADLAARNPQPALSGGESKKETHYALCPTCGLNALIYQEGCVSCASCGYTEC